MDKTNKTKQPIKIYHRGDTKRGQENSLDAIACNNKWIEIDVDCSDENFYLKHDNKNIINENGKLSFKKDINYNDMILKYDKSRKVITFENLLHYLNLGKYDVRLCLDLKLSSNFTKKDCERINKLIHLINTNKKIIEYVSSFNINLFVYLHKRIKVNKGLFMSAETVGNYVGEQFVDLIKPQYLIYSVKDPKLLNKLDKSYIDTTNVVLYTVHQSQVEKLDDEILNKLDYIVVDTF